MEKLIHLAQVEQTLKQMRDFCAYQSDKMLLDEVKHKLSSLPTEESGWIAVRDLAIKARQDMFKMHVELSRSSYESINALLDAILLPKQ